MVKFALILFLVLNSTFLLSQNNALKVKGKITNTGIGLRWAFTTESQAGKYIQQPFVFVRYQKNTPLLKITDTVGAIRTKFIVPFTTIADTTLVNLTKENEQFAIVNDLLKRITTANVKDGLLDYVLFLKALDFNFSAALRLNHAYEDKNIDTTKFYAYLVYPAGNKKVNNFCVIEPKRPLPIPVGEKLTIKNKQVYFRFNAKKYETYYGGYWFEKSTDGVNFTRVSALPYVFSASQFEKDKTHQDFTDTLSTCGIDYYYRICGIDFFSTTPVIGAALKTFCKPLLSVFPVYDTAYYNHATKSIVIRWKKEDYIKHGIQKINLYKANLDSAQYTLVNEYTINTSLATHATDVVSGYYKIAFLSAYDTSYSFSKYIHVPDTVAPEKIKNLTATINNKGIVELAWDKNSEVDLVGYRVLKRNAENEEFVELTKKLSLQNTFTDTLVLQTLTKKTYYTVCAVDGVKNSSQLSNVVAVVRPDVVPPVSATIGNATITDSSIVFNFIPSVSDDVKAYQLSRKKGSVSTIVATKLALDTTGFVLEDKTVINNENYTYQLITMDSAGNFSVSGSRQFTYVGKGKLMVTVNHTINKENSTIQFQFLNLNTSIYSVEIYRGKNGEIPLPLITFDRSVTTWTDNTVTMGNSYTYRFKIVYNNGTEVWLPKTTNVNL